MSTERHEQAPAQGTALRAAHLLWKVGLIEKDSMEALRNRWEKQDWLEELIFLVESNPEAVEKLRRILAQSDYDVARVQERIFFETENCLEAIDYISKASEKELPRCAWFSDLAISEYPAEAICAYIEVQRDPWARAQFPPSDVDKWLTLTRDYGLRVREFRAFLREEKREDIWELMGGRGAFFWSVMGGEHRFATMELMREKPVLVEVLKKVKQSSSSFGVAERFMALEEVGEIVGLSRVRPEAMEGFLIKNLAMVDPEGFRKFRAMSLGGRKKILSGLRNVLNGDLNLKAEVEEYVLSQGGGRTKREMIEGVEKVRKWEEDGARFDYPLSGFEIETLGGVGVDPRVYSFLHWSGWRMGFGGIEVSPGPFAHWRTSITAYNRWRELGLIDLDKEYRYTLHFNLGVTLNEEVHALAVMLSATGYASDFEFAIGKQEKVSYVWKLWRKTKDRGEYSEMKMFFALTDEGVRKILGLGPTLGRTLKGAMTPGMVEDKSMGQWWWDMKKEFNEALGQLKLGDILNPGNKWIVGTGGVSVKSELMRRFAAEISYVYPDRWSRYEDPGRLKPGTYLGMEVGRPVVVRGVRYANLVSFTQHWADKWARRVIAREKETIGR